MPGDWIPMRIDLAGDTDVIAIAAAIGTDEDGAVGRLLRFWGWADQHTTDGNARGVTYEWIDRRIGTTGFAAALESRGWLAKTPDGIRVPNFERFLGKGGKARLKSNARVARHRGAKPSGNALTVTETVTTEQNRTKDSPNGESPPKGGRRARKAGWSAEDMAEGKAVIAAWNDLPDVRKVVDKLGDKRTAMLRKRLQDSRWRANWRKAVAMVGESDFCRGQNDRGWIADFEWFIRPDTLTKIIEGRYANNPRGHPQRSGQGSRFDFLRPYVDGGGDDGIRDGNVDGLPVERDGEAV